MLNKSIVYWAPPTEVAAIRNTAENMVTNNLIKTRFILEKILDNINKGDKVGIKVHVGEAYNTRYLRHDYIHEVVDVIKSKGGIPTLIETQGNGMNIQLLNITDTCSIFLGSRKTTTEHNKIAHLHGYTESLIGAPLRFIDGEKGLDGKIINIDGIHFKDVSVAIGLFEFDKLVIVSHFKGHPQAGFGGAMKNLGIGCTTKRNKSRAHLDGSFIVDPMICNISKCNQECIEACPVNAIKINGESAVIDSSLCIGCFGCKEKCSIRKAIQIPAYTDLKKFCERLIDNTMAVITSFGPEKIRYINFALELTLMCDCVSNPSVPIAPDLGIFGSSDPLAIDRACIDAEINAPGLPVLDENGKWLEPLPPGVEKFNKKLNAMSLPVNTSWQFEAAVKNNIGNINYELIKI
jgi:uncharacterized Fe-S center protein